LSAAGRHDLSDQVTDVDPRTRVAALAFLAA
jgi:hypothetical protein